MGLVAYRNDYHPSSYHIDYPQNDNYKYYEWCKDSHVHFDFHTPQSNYDNKYKFRSSRTISRANF